ncbi:MAG: hypothetical protein JXL81_03520 [Deltaproteobacteria bacterium]|nr:hypothetical protein [Deltaproteobacteria bacterium]
MALFKIRAGTGACPYEYDRIRCKTSETLAGRGACPYGLNDDYGIKNPLDPVNPV